MDFRQLDPTELAQLQTHLQTLVDCACIQSNQSQQTTNLPMGPPSSLEHPPSILSPIPSVLPPTTMGNLIGLYQSVCISSVAQVPWGHPSQATIQMSAGPQPFLGQNSPAISMSDQVNQQWHVSAANHPRQPRLPSCGRRQGPAVPPPPSPHHYNGQQIEDCLSTSISNDIEIPTICVKVKIYLPTVLTNYCCITLFTNYLLQQENNRENLIFYRFLRESWTAQLESYYLLYTYKLPLSTLVTTLIQHVVSDMKASPFSYSFKLPRLHGQTYSPHEVLDLLLLEFINRGVPCPNDNQIQLCCGPRWENQTLEDLHRDHAHFGIPSLVIEGTYLVINMGQWLSRQNYNLDTMISDLFSSAIVVCCYPVTVVSSLSLDNPIAHSHTHTCISHKIYHKFRLNSSTGLDEDNETNWADSSSDDQNGSTTPPQQPISLTSTSLTEPQQPAHSAVTITNSALKRSCSLSMFTFILSMIWKDIWTPQPGPYAGFFSVETMADEVYAAVIDGILVEDLDICAPSMSDLIKTFKTMLGDAAKEGDFMHILSPNCSFYMWVIKFMILGSVLKSNFLAYQLMILELSSLWGKELNMK